VPPFKKVCLYKRTEPNQALPGIGELKPSTYADKPIKVYHILHEIASIFSYKQAQNSPFLQFIPIKQKTPVTEKILF
jgi:hypothetical protein